MRFLRVVPIFLFASASLTFAQSPAAKAAATITADDVKQHIAFIASDAMRGRDTPSPELDSVASYIAAQFKSYGLKPGGENGTYLQHWPYKAQTLDVAKVSAELHTASGHQKLAWASEWFLVPAPQVDSLAGEIVFGGVAGPGAVPNPLYRDAIVAFYTPGGELSQAWVNNIQPIMIAALGSGARGVMLILDPEFGADDIADVVGSLGSQAVPAPIIAVRNDVARSWLKDSGITLDSAGTAGVAPKLISGPTVVMRSGMNGIDATAPNVVGILEGSDPVLKDTYVVYSAHMDHVGVGAPNEKGDSIYNGADDDASGTSAVLEVAQAYAGMQPRPKRSVIFLLVSGEEKGLFGSAYFVNHPPVPIEKIVTNINIDMIGRNAVDTTVAIGQGYSSLGEITQTVVKAHPELKLNVVDDLWPEEQLFFRSDHFNFAMKKVPAIFFTSGLHGDYHKPSDQPETIDNDKLMRTARMVFWLGYEVANSATAPTWTEAGLKAIEMAGGN